MTKDNDKLIAEVLKCEHCGMSYSECAVLPPDKSGTRKCCDNCNHYDLLPMLEKLAEKARAEGFKNGRLSAFKEVKQLAEVKL